MPRKKRLHEQIARMDPQTPEAGLFQVRPTNAPRLHAQEFFRYAKADDGEEIELKYVTPYTLNHVDLKIFLAIVGMCSANPDLLEGKSEEPLQRTLWDRFLTIGPASGMPGAKIQTTSYALAKVAGLNWGKHQARRITDSLERMSAVTSTWRKMNKSIAPSQSRMISYAHDEDSGELVLAVSPHFAKAILGEADSYIQVSLHEMRELKHPVATVLHMVISSRLNLGGRRKEREMFIHIDKLAEAAYGPADSSAQRRGRRRQVASALEELHELDYWFTQYNPETHKVHVHRVLPGNKHLEKMMDDVEKIESELNKED